MILKNTLKKRVGPQSKIAIDVAMLPPDEIEYTALGERVKELEERFEIRE